MMFIIINIDHCVVTVGIYLHDRNRDNVTEEV